MVTITTNPDFWSVVTTFYRNEQIITHITKDGVPFIESCRSIFMLYENHPYVLYAGFLGSMPGTIESGVGKGCLLERDVRFRVYTVININSEEFRETWSYGSSSYFFIVKEGGAVKYLDTVFIGDVLYTTPGQNLELLYKLYNLGALNIQPRMYKPTIHKYKYFAQYEAGTLISVKRAVVEKTYD